MLSFLSIRNVALIEKIDIAFGLGLNVVTGETGAGKSIIIEALSLVLGGRAHPSAIRTGEKQAMVQATFTIGKNRKLLAACEQLGVAPEEGEISVRREINDDGQNRCFVNGIKSPLKTVKDLGDLLVDVHGQNEHQSLLGPAYQRECIDAYAGASDLCASYSARYEAYSEKKAACAALEARSREIGKQREFLEFQFRDLIEAGLSPGKEAELLSRIKRAERGHKTTELRQKVQDQLNDDFLKRLASAEKAALQLAAIDHSFAGQAAAIADLRKIAGEVVSACDREFSADDEPADIEALNSGLAQISRLKRKYGKDEQGLVDLLNQTRADLDLLENTSFEKNRLEKEAAGLYRDMEKAGKQLSAERKKAAASFDKKINQALAAINMGEAAFATCFTPFAEYSPSGGEGLEFMIAANPGEPQRPLSKIASGGETSRGMLAVKSVLAAADRIPVLVFDEIDAGTGGETAVAIGAALKKLSAFHQLFCVTHLHQIASAADAHFLVSKSVERSRAHVAIRELCNNDRVAEIARMLGNAKSRIGLSHARELVEGTV